MSDNCAKLGEFGGVFIVAAMEAQRSGDVAREVALLLAALEAVDEPVHLRLHLARWYSDAERRLAGQPVDKSLGLLVTRLRSAEDAGDGEAWVRARADVARALGGVGVQLDTGFRALGGAC